MTKLELLSPAKDLKIGITAINFGADAVYIGAEKFGARASAANSIADIEQLIKYAHKYYAKVYATVNTIFNDREAESVRDLIYRLYNIGADALIIQDMGILEMDIPSIPLFASTQTNNYELERIKFLESVGISRVILARELSLGQIREIRDNTNVELESFVYGALCVSLSGQCYISQSACSRSANRGQCSQICRHKFNLSDQQGNLIITNKHLLSLKDLNLENYIADLVNAGISSFKIEGRLKDINYVKNMTAYFRNKIDIFLNHSDKYLKSSSGYTELDFVPNIESTFNRTFTNYFIDDSPEKMANIETPKYVGKYIGSVIKCEPNRLILDTEIQINNGDGLSYFTKNNELKGFRVNRAIENTILLLDNIDTLPVGTKLYRNQDIEFENALNSSKSNRKITANISISENPDKINFSISDENNNTALIEIANNYIIADNKDKAQFNLKKQLSKSGNSIYRIKNINNNIENIYFIPISELNNIRRELILKLDLERERNRPLIEINKGNLPISLMGKTLDYKSNIMNCYAKKFYEKLGAEVIELSPELTHNYTDKILMNTRYCIKRELGQCPKSNSESTLGKTLYLEDDSNKYILEFDCKICFMKVILAR